MKYRDFKKKCCDRVNKLPIFYAFNYSQLDSILEENNLSKKDICSLSGGAFIKNSDKGLVEDLFNSISNERIELMKNDDFVIDMFKYEMSNYEYVLNYDDLTVLDACGISADEFNKDSRLSSLFIRAKVSYLEEVI